MLKVRGIESVDGRVRDFRIEDGGRPASEASLSLVALYLRKLLSESELQGRCRVASEGHLALDLPETESFYFYDGLVFAALDAFNSPNKNPTITDLRVPDE